MLRAGKVAVGKYYVDSNRRIARQVLGISDNTILFNTYHLDTGNSTGYPSECLKSDFRHWADHVATQMEINILHIHQLEAQLHTPQGPNPEEPKH